MSALKPYKEPVLPHSLEKADSIYETRLTYIDMLIILAIKYVQGHSL